VAKAPAACTVTTCLVLPHVQCAAVHILTDHAHGAAMEISALLSTPFQLAVKCEMFEVKLTRHFLRKILSDEKEKHERSIKCFYTFFFNVFRWTLSFGA